MNSLIPGMQVGAFARKALPLLGLMRHNLVELDGTARKLLRQGAELGAVMRFNARLLRSSLAALGRGSVLLGKALAQSGAEQQTPGNPAGSVPAQSGAVSLESKLPKPIQLAIDYESAIADLHSTLRFEPPESNAVMHLNAGLLGSSLAALGRDSALLGKTLAQSGREQQTPDNPAGSVPAQLGAVSLEAKLPKPIQLAIDYESAIADLRSTLRFEPPESITKLGDQLLQLSGRTPLLQNELLALAKEAAQLGVAIEDIPSYIEASVNSSDNFQARLGTSRGQLLMLENSLTALGVQLGTTLLPALNGMLEALTPIILLTANWVSEHPVLVGNLLLLALGSRLFGKALFRLFSVLGKVLEFIVLIKELGGLGAVLGRAWSFANGIFGRLGQVFRGAGRGALWLGQAVSRGLGFAWSLAKGVFSRMGGALSLMGQAFRIAGQAVLWLGRALLMNPIGLLITGIAVAGYLIYRYWEPIKSFFGKLWQEVKASFSGGLSGILGLIINFNPIGLFYRAFSAVMGYFGIELPGKFSEFGSLILNSLISGISGLLGSVAEVMTGLGTQLKDSFNTALDSIIELLVSFDPLAIFQTAFDKVIEFFAVDLAQAFTSLGAGLVTSLMNGIAEKAIELKDGFIEIGSSIHQYLFGDDEEEQTLKPLRLGDGLRDIPAPAANPPQEATQSQGNAPQAAALAQTVIPRSSQQNSAINLNYHPQITVQAGAAVSRESIQQALQAERGEIERIMREVLSDMKRRAF